MLWVFPKTNCPGAAKQLYWKFSLQFCPGLFLGYDVFKTALEWPNKFVQQRVLWNCSKVMFHFVQGNAHTQHENIDDHDFRCLNFTG